MKVNIAVDISPPIPYLAKLCLSIYGPKCQRIFRKTWGMKLISCTCR